MLESIRSLTDVPAADDVLVVREDIAAAKRRRLLLEEARRQASRYIAEATAEVELIQAHAYQEGYAQGVLQAASDVSRALVQSRTLAMRLRVDLGLAAKELLGDLITRDELLDEVLKRWLAEQDVHAEALLQIIVPQRCKPRQKALREQLKTFWHGPVSIDYHTEERYLVRLADQLIELDVEATQERLAPRLLAQLASLPSAVRDLDLASVQALQSLAASFVTSADDTNQSF
jgi:hypothetical protein